MLPQLVPNFKDLISPQELAGLACEEIVESRLITEISSGRWQLQHGPFVETDFTNLPDKHWTILVQAVDHWIEEIAALRSLFEFIPRWRIDDVMVSYATDAGGVGPHFDYYDVFLLQGSGQRLWQVGDKVAPDTKLDIQDGVGILPTFSAEHEFILNPGDALYIPPQYAHWGRSIGESTCYSIGFRAPAMSDMLEGFSDMLIARSLPSVRFTDSAPVLPEHPAQIDLASLLQAFQQLRETINTPDQFCYWFGCWVTLPKYPELREALSKPLTRTTLQIALKAGKQLLHGSAARFAFLPIDNGTSILLFVDGEAFRFPAEFREVILQICDLNALKQIDFNKLEQPDIVLNLALQLLNQGSLQLS